LTVARRLRIDPLSFPRAQGVTLSVVVATTEAPARLADALAALRDARLALPYEVIVVAREPLPGRLRCTFPLVQAYCAPEAEDLGGLYDVGAQVAGGRHLLLLDGAAFPGAAAVAELVRFADTGQWIGAVVPRYMAEDGAERPASRPFPTPLAALREAIGLARPAGGPAPRLHHALARTVTTPKEVDAAEAGCVLIRRQAVLDVGGFAAGYAPGGEILDWCMRARLKGWAVFYHPGAQARLAADGPRRDGRAIARRFVRRFHGLLPALALDAVPRTAS
jgi:GT2 family glycosyltransferase